MKFMSGVFGSRQADLGGEPEIATARLLLRPLSAADGPAIARHLADIEVARWLVRVPHPFGEGDAAAFIAQSRLTQRAGTAVTLGLIRRGAADGMVIGVVALHSMDVRPEFGYWLGRPFWGKGLMGEAVEAVLAWAYERLPIDEVAAGAFVGNCASLAIQRRQGFEQVGSSRRLSIAEGVLRDHVDTRLTRARHARRPWLTGGVSGP